MFEAKMTLRSRHDRSRVTVTFKGASPWAGRMGLLGAASGHARARVLRMLGEGIPSSCPVREEAELGREWPVLWYCLDLLRYGRGGLEVLEDDGPGEVPPERRLEAEVVK